MKAGCAVWLPTGTANALKCGPGRGYLLDLFYSMQETFFLQLHADRTALDRLRRFYHGAGTHKKIRCHIAGPAAGLNGSG